MKKVITIFLIILPVISMTAQSRIEATQWYTDNGYEDAFETEIFDVNNRRTYICAQMAGTIIYSYFIYYGNDKIVKYNLKGEISSIEEKGYKEKIITYYKDGDVYFKTIITDLGGDRKRFISIDLPDNKVNEYYEYHYEGDIKVTEWFDPVTMKAVRTKREPEQVIEYLYERIHDGTGRVIKETATREDKVIYIKNITYM